MSYASVPDALVMLLRTVPGIVTVSRGDQYRVTRRGGVIPKADQCPEVRISPGAVRIRNLTLNGDQRRTSDYDCDLWVYENDPILATDAWPTLRETVATLIKESRPGLRQLPGVKDVKLVSEMPPRRVQTASKQGLLHTTFVVQVLETV